MNSSTLGGKGLEALGLVAGFMLMTIGWVLMYPVAIANGNILERIATQPDAWDWGHRLLLLGAMVQPVSSFLLFRYARDASVRLSHIALTLSLAGSMALIGQYALDFALLAQADTSIIFAPSKTSIVELVRQNLWASFFFYDLGEFLFLGQILFVFALFKAKGILRISAYIVFIGLLLIFVSGTLPAIIIRFGFAIITLGYSIATLHIFKK